MIQYYTISDEARSLVLLESNNCFPNETGGVLVGKLTGDCVQIEHALNAGPKALCSPNNFKRDGDYSQDKLDAIVKESNGEFDYVGEWHSHPTPSFLSPVDIRSMRWIVDNINYAITTPILLLRVRDSKAKWRIHCYCFTRNSIIQLRPH